MTHRYTLMIGGIILPGTGETAASAIGWAGDTILAIGSDASVSDISRGDSHVVDLRGAFVVPLDVDPGGGSPGAGTLEVGGPASFIILASDPGDPGVADASGMARLAVIRGGRLVSGRLPGGDSEGHAHEDDH